MIENSTNQKKVCHVTSAHPRYDVRIFHKECKSLANNGFNVTLLVNDNLPNESIDGVMIVSTQLKPKNRFERMVKSLKKLKKLMLEIDADIYHFHDPELLLLVKVMKMKNKKVIFDSHEHYSTQIKEKKYIPGVIRGVTSQVYRLFEDKVLKRVDNIIFPCTINGLYPFEDHVAKTVLINNFPKMDEFYEKYIEDGEKDNSICYTGVLSYNRGITYAVMASYKSNIKLKLAGKFSSNAYQIELEKMKEFKNVEYLGYLKRDEITNIYIKSNIGICTLLNLGQYNNTDNLPTKAYEYMAMGLPVILSDSAYARKLIREYNFGFLVDPQNIVDISEAINRLISNPKISKEIGNEGRRAVKEKFNWDVEEEKLIELYNNLLVNNL